MLGWPRLLVPPPEPIWGGMLLACSRAVVDAFTMNNGCSRPLYAVRTSSRRFRHHRSPKVSFRRVLRIVQFSVRVIASNLAAAESHVRWPVTNSRLTVA